MPQMDRPRVSTAKLLSVVVDGDYYGGSSAAVPFKWESQPGTPRRLFERSSSDSDFNSPVSAPLTPPPSYSNASPPNSTNKPVKPKKPNTHLGSLRPKNRSTPSSPAASSSSSSSSSTSSPLRTPDLLGRDSRRSMWFGSASSLGGYVSSHHNNNAKKSSGCYASIFKVLLRDVK